MNHLTSAALSGSANPVRAFATRLGLGAAISGLLALVACGSDGLKPADFGGADESSSSSGSSGASGGISSGGISSSGGTSSSGASSSGAPACAKTSADAKNTPIYMAFIYDKSGSMKDNGKWDACKAGIESFFASPSSKGASASIAFFPSGKGSGNNQSCTVTDYSTPAVGMTKLPDPGTLKQALEGESPNGDGTPTRPALDGAIQYAKAHAKGAGSDGKVVVVLVTDGEPNICSSTVPSVAAVAAAGATDIPTFVIGVGNTGNLNTIAQSGGTKSAIVVQTGNPTQTQTDLQKAIEQIKNSLSCDYTIPAPPQGETFDSKKVNVVHTPDGGQRDELSYNQACNGAGWRYDDIANPKHILICDTSCTALKDKPGKLEIELGCETKGDIPK